MIMVIFAIVYVGCDSGSEEEKKFNISGVWDYYFTVTGSNYDGWFNITQTDANNLTGFGQLYAGYYSYGFDLQGSINGKDVTMKWITWNTGIVDFDITAHCSTESNMDGQISCSNWQNKKFTAIK